MGVCVCMYVLYACAARVRVACIACMCVYVCCGDKQFLINEIRICSVTFLGGAVRDNQQKTPPTRAIVSRVQPRGGHSTTERRLRAPSINTVGCPWWGGVGRWVLPAAALDPG